MAKIQADLETLQLDVAPLCRAEIKCLLLLLFSHDVSSSIFFYYIAISTTANVDSAKTTVTTR